MIRDCGGNCSKTVGLAHVGQFAQPQVEILFDEAWTKYVFHYEILQCENLDRSVHEEGMVQYRRWGQRTSRLCEDIIRA